MVTAQPAQNALSWLQRDWAALKGAFAPKPLAPPAPGLYTYRITPPGGQARIHLRIEPDGAGVLFVDVTDVVHLNATAAQIAKAALDEAPREQVRAALWRQYHGLPRAEVEQQIAQVYQVVDEFRHPERGCPTCTVTSIQRKDLFSIRARAPFKADLALTYGCNNECPHCYNEADRLEMPSLPAEAWYRVIDTLNRVGVPHLIFTGGEATLHPDLPAIIRYADSKGHVTGLNTNGRRLAHRPYADTLAQAGLNHVQITLGSARPAVHDAMMGAVSFHQTVKGIETALASGLHTITNTTLMQANANHVEEIIDFLYALGIRTFAMNGMIYSGGGFADPLAIPEENMAPLLVRVRDHAAERGMKFLWYTPTEYCRLSPVELEIGAKRCNAGEYSICIEPNGDVLPCQSYYVTAGNLLNNAWDTIWQGELFRSFRDREQDPRGWGLPEKCWECPDLPLCGGGCRIEREARDGHRVADDETSGGGCAGCSGACGTRRAHSNATLATAGFIPNASLTRATKRASGHMIALEEIVGL
jgi:radical SAM protein with 4Fe4S-binding SPASM domain